MGMVFRQSFDHLTLGQRVVSVWGADSNRAESEGCKASEMWERADVSC
jgi:hypothetical protein